MARVPYTCPYRLVWAMFDSDPAPAARMHRHYAGLIWRKPDWQLRAKLIGIFLFWWVNTAWIAARCLWRLGFKVKRATGKGVWRQLAEILYVDLRHSIAPDFYYKYELFHPDRLRDAKHYLMRYEFKGGWHVIADIAVAEERGLGRAPVSRRIINDKALFGLVCREAGIRAATPLLTIDAAGRVRWLDHPGPDLPPIDLFCKPLKSKGGRGCERWRWRGGDRYSDGATELGSGALLRHLQERCRKYKNYVVQPCLANHPDIADLGQGTLTTCRFLSLRNERGEIEVTHAMFKLAFRKDAVIDNFHAGGSVAAVDMATGRLGPASDSGLDEPCIWHTHHPATGLPIEGRVLPMWPETVDLVRRAHRRFDDRVMIGWDVAFTPDGPCIVEGNVQSATDMVQRTHALPAGIGRLAEIYAWHLDRAPDPARRGVAPKFKLPGADMDAIRGGIMPKDTVGPKAPERLYVAVQAESRAALDRVAEIAAAGNIELTFVEPAAKDGVAGLLENGHAFVIAGNDLKLLGPGLSAMRNAARSTATAAAEHPAPVMRQRDAGTSIRRMRQFWIAWCVAVLLLGAAIVGFGYLFALSESWPHWVKIGGRAAAGLLAAFAVYDAYRIAARGTAAFQEVLAQNLASIVVAELERLDAAAARRKLALAARDEPGALGLSLTSWSFDGEDVRNLLGNPTEEALRDVLASIAAYNRLIDTLAAGDTQAETGLARQIEEISLGINRAMASVAGRLEAYRHGAH
jgi:hypothetical protein